MHDPRSKSRKPAAAAIAWLGLMLACLPLLAAPRPGSLDVRWHAGAPDCARTAPPPLQVHRYNANTWVLRQNPCASFEAPFLYLLAGSRRALLIDSGAVADAGAMPLARTVLSLLPRVGGTRLPLTVVHTHSHRDHRAGDGQFRGLPGVEVAPTDLDGVRKFFGFPGWPDGTAQIHLGDRIVDVIPTPGHTDSHVSYYDRQAALLFTGDFLLPGRLIIEDADADLASAERIAVFLGDRPVQHVLGAHVELDVDGRTLPMGSTHHPRERGLALGRQDVIGLADTIAGFNGLYGRRGMYVMYDPSRLLLLGLAGVLLVLVVLALLLVRFLRRRRRRLRLANHA